MKKLNILVLIIAAVMLSLIFTGCNKADVDNKTPSSEGNNPPEEKEEGSSTYGIKINDETVEFTDETGEEITIKKNPQRVIVLYNSFLEIWDQAGGTVVGRVTESEDKIVENAMSAEVVGSLSTPSLEKILSLQPDLVIANISYKAQREMVPALKQNNIQVMAVHINLLEDYYRAVRLFTAITGREDLYENNVNEIQSKIDEIISKAPTDKNYKAAVLLATSKNITVRDSNTMVGEMLKDLNVTNILDNAGGSSDTKTFSIEKIIQEDPDFIFVQTMGNDLEKITERLKSDAQDNPAWASLKAVKEDRYIVLPKDLYLYKPNDRYPEAYEGLGKIFYPEVYGE
jgi:iron complex transport system substrate-binding protein